MISFLERITLPNIIKGGILDCKIVKNELNNVFIKVPIENINQKTKLGEIELDPYYGVRIKIVLLHLFDDQFFWGEVLNWTLEEFANNLQNSMYETEVYKLRNIGSNTRSKIQHFINIGLGSTTTKLM